MKAIDVMTRNLVTIKPDASVMEAAKLMYENDVSALPVVDIDGELIGIVSEADLMRRKEIGTEKQRRWWIEAMTPAATLTEEFVKSHGQRVEEVDVQKSDHSKRRHSLAEIATFWNTTSSRGSQLQETENLSALSVGAT